MIRFNILQIGAGGPLRKHCVGNPSSKYLLVIFEDFSDYVRLDSMAACIVAVPAEILLR